MAADPEERRRRLLDDVPESIKKARAEQQEQRPLPVHPVPESETTIHHKTHRGGRRHSNNKTVLKQDTVLGEEPARAASSAADVPSTALVPVLTGPALRANMLDDVPIGMKRGGV
eukprot:12303893-Heterocapsa_arctica.AAC.1